MTSLLPALVGLALGVRHAFEPDHLAAVSTLATEQKSARAGVLVGAWWGLGHTVALLAVGGSLALVEAQMPARAALAFEVLVGVMVVGLGLRALKRSLAEGRAGAVTTHAHAGVAHTHAASGHHLHVSGWTLATRPLLVGLVHGLAGSGALTALVLAELPSAGARLSYIVLFGLGSVVGMALLTGLAGVSLMRVARAPRAGAAMLGAAGLMSIGLGAFWALSSAHALSAL
jgi:high-affinity nickel-transport protein